MLPIPNEGAIRLGVFLGVLGAMTLWEILSPKRPLRLKKSSRWASNLLLVLLDTVAVRFLVPITITQFALQVEGAKLGLLNMTPLPSWLKVLTAVVILDFIIYLQHLMFHAVPFLWKLHMIHHADLDIDVTTGVRFHPIEILISIGIKLGTVYVLGAPALAVLIFEVVLNGCAMFNHSNVQIPKAWDSVLRVLLVTPDMHRVHHSVIMPETNSNFGFNIPLWDRLCGTYRAQPEKGHLGMTIGLSQLQNSNVAKLSWILAAPFSAKAGGYPIGRED